MKKYQKEDWDKKIKFIPNFVPESTNELERTIINKSFYINIYYSDCLNELGVYLKHIFPKLYEYDSDIKYHIYNFEIFEDYVKKGKVADFSTEDINQFIFPKECFVIHRNISYDQIMQEKYSYKYHFYLYSTYELDHLVVSDLRHSMSIGCIPIIHKNTYMVFTDLNSFINNLPPPFKLTELLNFLGSIMNVSEEKHNTVITHNKSIFKKKYKKEDWVKQFSKFLV